MKPLELGYDPDGYPYAPGAGYSWRGRATPDSRHFTSEGRGTGAELSDGLTVSDTGIRAAAR